MSSRLSLLAGIGILLITIVLFFGGIELLLRVTGIDSGVPRTPPIYQKSGNPVISYTLKPSMQETAFRSTITTNDRGLRSPELDPAKLTIAVLGDSVTFGYGLEDHETVPARLSALLEGPYNVLNAGVPGYMLTQEAALYREKIAALNPQALILIFFWNDLTQTAPGVLDDAGQLHGPDWKPTGEPECHPVTVGILRFIPGKCWLDIHSAFYRTMKKIVTSRQEQRNLTEQREQFRKNAFGDAVTEEQLRRYEEHLSQFVRDLPPALPRLFVIWPEKELHFFAVPRLQDIAERHGFRVLNLYEVFGNKAETLSWDTVHPSAKTAEEAAAVIRAALEYWGMIE